jgi:hypothetical protein
MSQEVEEVPMLKNKRRFDPLFEALWKRFNDNIVIPPSSHLHFENLGIGPSDDRV